MDPQTVFRSVVEIVPDVNRRFLAILIYNIASQFQIVNPPRITNLEQFAPEENDENHQINFVFRGNGEWTGDVLQMCIEHLFENANYPRHVVKRNAPEPRQALANLPLPNLIVIDEADDAGPTAAKRPTPEPSVIDLDVRSSSASSNSEKDYEYTKQATALLQNEFCWFFVKAIETAMKMKNNSYTESRKFLLGLISPYFDPEVNLAAIDPVQPQYPARLTAIISEKIKSRIIEHEDKKFRLLKVFRKVLPHAIAVTHSELLEEINRLRQSPQNAEELGAIPVECLICCGETCAETLVACLEGHIYCQDCMSSYIETKIQDGVRKGFLECMQNDCEAPFSQAVLLARMPSDLIERLDERIAGANLNIAGLEGIVRCPKCSAVYELDQGIQVLNCVKCNHASCRRCQQAWTKDHVGKKCEELETTDETLKRRLLEERLTAELIRPCPKCKTPLLKNEGCNKMTCSCGATMCYVCRTPFIKYDHFCQHPRNPGQGCDQCNACSLWIDPAAADQERIKLIEEEASKKLEEEKKARLAKLNGPSTSKTLSSDPPSKQSDGTANSAVMNMVSSFDAFLQTLGKTTVPETKPAPPQQVVPVQRVPHPVLFGAVPPPLIPNFWNAPNRNAPVAPRNLHQAVPLVMDALMNDRQVGLIREMVETFGVQVLLTHFRGQSTALHKAAQHGKVVALAAMLDLGVPVSPRDPATGRTPLHVAITYRKANVTSLLLDRGENANVADRHGQTALHMAAVLCDVNSAQHLLRHGANIRAVDAHGWEPIHYAGRTGQYEMLRLLLRYNAAVNALNGRNWETVLHLACRNGRKTAVELLLDQPGIDVNARDFNGDTPLHLSASVGANFSTISARLIAKGAEFDVRNNKNQTPLDLALKHDMKTWNLMKNTIARRLK